MKPWFFIILMLFSSALAHADTLHVVNEKLWPLRVDGQALMHEDRSGDLTLEEAAALPVGTPAGFMPMASATSNRSSSRSVWWVQLHVVNDGVDPLSLRLLLGEPGIGRLDFYIDHKDKGLWTHAALGQRVPLSQQPSNGTRLPSIPFRLERGDSARIMARIQTDKPVWLKAQLFSEAAYQKAEARLTIWEGIHLGGLLALAWCALLVALFGRSARFLLLSALCFIIVLYEASLRGYSKLYLWPNTTEWAYRSPYIFGYLSLAMFLVFVMTMAKAENIHWPARRYFGGLAVLFAFMSAAAFVADLYWVSMVGAFTSLLYAASITVAAIALLKRSAPTGKLMLLTGGFVLTQAALRTLQRMGLLPDAVNRLTPLTGSVDNPAIALFGLAVNLAVLTGWIILIARQRQHAQTALSTWQSQEQERLKAEVERQTAGLSKALKYADQKNRQKTETLGYISHDLRAPLATIVGYARLLKDNPQFAESQAVLAIERSANYQLALIDDLLDYAKNELQPLELKPAAVDLPSLLDDIVQHASVLSAQQGNRFRCEATTHLPSNVILDARRVQQVLLNLLSNAAKFTRRGTIELRVSAIRSGKDWLLNFTVSDSGIGMEIGAQPVMFQAFAQAQPQHGGVGLGLFIAKHVIENMGGRLSVESAPNAGSRFSFEIKLPDANGQEANWMPTRYGPNELAEQPIESSHSAQRIPPADARMELAELARDGQLSDIEDWLQRMAALHPSYRWFYEQVHSALHILDFGRIESLALSGSG